MKKNKGYFFEYFLNFTCIFMDTIQRALSLIPICIFTVTESITRLLNDRGFSPAILISCFAHNICFMI